MSKLFIRMAALIIAAGMVLAGCEDIPGGGNGGAAYTVTFDAGEDGSVSPASVEVVSGGTVGGKMPGNPTNTNTDKFFGGWFTGDGTGGGWGSQFTQTTPVTAHITVYAKWETTQPESFTVTFDSAGGSTVTPIPNIAAGSTIALPAAPTRDGYTFGGWYTGANGNGTAFTGETPVTENITLYAKWTQNSTGAAVIPVNSMAQLKEVIAPYGSRTIQLAAGNYSFTSATVDDAINISGSRGKNITILPPDSGTATISLTSGSLKELFQVNSGGTLTLGKPGATGSIVIDGGNKPKGNSQRAGELVTVYGSAEYGAGTFIMEDGVTLTNNNRSGVSVGSNGVFEMRGGYITGNRTIMDGGGVWISGGTFIMEAGTISDNAAEESSGDGGGVSVSFGNTGGTFTMNGGVIKRNVAGYHGGGVYVGNNGTFTMEGGTIYGASYTGGVLNNSDVANHCAPNTTDRGHAVYVDGGSGTYNGNPLPRSTNTTLGSP